MLRLVGQRQGVRIRTLCIESSAHSAILMNLMRRPAEECGILLGPRGLDVINRFEWDEGAKRTRGTVSPDHITLSRRLKEEWWPAGLEIKGFAHSHPDSCEQLSRGDLRYIQRFFETYPSMRWFAAPLVFPERFWIKPFVVSRDPLIVHEVTLEVVDTR